MTEPLTTRPRPHLTEAMAHHTAALLASLDEEQNRLARAPMTTGDARTWTYLPGTRPGLSLEEMNEHQRELALELLDCAQGAGGAEASDAMAVERLRRQLATGVEDVGPDRYWFRILGDPGTSTWAWRMNGHHVAVHVTVAGAQFTVTPHFLGAEPAVQPSGQRLLGPEEDLPRALLDALDPERLTLAVTSGVAPDDILTRFDPVADPSVLPAGLRHADMERPAQDLLEQLVRRYLDRAPSSYAQACWREVCDEGLGAVSFAWEGSRQHGEGHYYCVVGPTMLIEYDNTQDSANHAHSVWRHRRDDWGEDMLRRHYAQHHDAT